MRCVPTSFRSFHHVHRSRDPASIARNADGEIVEISGKRFKIGAEIGQGAFGVVKLAAEIGKGSKAGPQDYVVKLVRFHLLAILCGQAAFVQHGGGGIEDTKQNKTGLLYISHSETLLPLFFT